MDPMEDAYARYKLELGGVESMSCIHLTLFSIK
jgi:hypothetical protein